MFKLPVVSATVFTRLYSTATRIGRLTRANSFLFVCDMQEKFRKNIRYFPEIVEVTNRMIDAAKILEIPIICTEQYPQGLGPTVKELKLEGIPKFAKTRFSMNLPEVKTIMNEHIDRSSIMICGIENHVCVQETTLDLIENGIDVHVIVDACSSRSQVDRLVAFQRMRGAGAFLTTSESAMLTLCGGSDHKQFRAIQKLIMSPAPDSGLLGDHSPFKQA